MWKHKKQARIATRLFFIFNFGENFTEVDFFNTLSGVPIAIKPLAERL